MNEIEQQNKYEEILLKTVNTIGKSIKKELCFKNFEEANDNILIFSQSYFQKYKKSAESEEKDGIEAIKDFKGLIGFLSKREPKFKTLVFNFKKEQFKKPSTVLFYTNFLNSFFLEKKREELYDRCSIILQSERKMADLLTDWQTYISLVSFICNKKTNYDKDNYIDPNAYFLTKIPNIIDVTFLKECAQSEKLPDAIFYQLQFIFNILDQQHSGHHIIECFLAAINKFKQIKLKSFKKLTESIRVKNISLILQKKNNTQIEEKDQKRSFNEDQKFNESLYLSVNDTLFKTYIDRRKDSIFEKKPETTLEFDSIEEFWSQSDDNKVFDKGILFNQSVYDQRKEEMTDRWKRGIQEHLRRIKKSDVVNYEFRQKGSKIESKKLYKIFFYDEKQSKWQINPEFIQHLNANNDTTLIYFYNSYEEDIKTVKSTLTNCKYEEEGETDEIVVYLSICDNIKNLFNLLEIDKEIEATTPLILQLHVPPSKQGDPNLKNIIFQISTFLTFISDINIVILNEDHYEDQIDMIIELTNIKESYQGSNEFVKEKIFYGKVPKSKNVSDQISFEKVPEYNFLDDIDDETLEGIKNQNSPNERINKVNTNLLSNLSQPIFVKKPKHLLLFNDPHIIYTKITDSSTQQDGFISLFRNKFFEFCTFLSLHYRYINISDPNTYKGLIDSLIIIIDKMREKTKDVIGNLNCVQLTEMPPLYFKLKKKVNKKEAEKIKELENIQLSAKNSQINDEEKTMKITKIKNESILYKEMKEEAKKLYKFIYNKKFKEPIKKSIFLDEVEEDEEEDNGDKYYNHFSELSILLDVQKEFYSICPPVDRYFYYICTSVIADEGNELFDKDDIQSELEESSRYNMKILLNTIKKGHFWNEEEQNDIILSHKQILNSEFYDIIHDRYPPNDNALAYEQNENILTNIVERDVKILKQKFDEKNKEKSEGNKKNFKDKIRKGTNYHIRETEAETESELKLTVDDCNDLASFIDPDI